MARQQVQTKSRLTSVCPERMSFAVAISRALNGVDAPEVVVEAHLSNGLPSFTLVGLPDTEVKESRERVRAALLMAGFDFPARRITVNLAPADLPKESGRFDLPIALALLGASGQIPLSSLAAYEFAGELALTGALRPVRGALPMALGARVAGRSFILPQQNAAEAARVDGVCVLGATSLGEVCAHLAGLAQLQPVFVAPCPAVTGYPDLADVKGQAGARLALEVAAAGGHSLLMIGPPGTGKSMLAQRLPGLLPALTESEALEVAALQSLSSQGFVAASWGQHPFRAPHHSASSVAMVGGGSDPRPGEISLAHRGVLFLDELPEFDRRVLEALREPLESGEIRISRAARQVVFPAAFQLIAAMNPCPCGYLGHPLRACRCTPEQIARYRGKISGPLLDRIDLLLEVPPLAVAELQSGAREEGSEQVSARVRLARQRQMARQGKVNAALSAAEVDRFCLPDAAALSVLTMASSRMALSARAYHRILRVARTLADRDDVVGIGRAHVLLALQMRRALGNGAI